MLKYPRWDKPIQQPKQRRPLRRGTWWNPLTPREVFELDDFKAWVAVQPAGKTYDYTVGYECALFQYLQARGVPENLASFRPEEFRIPGLSEAVMGPSFNGVSTFGALSLRLMAVVADGEGANVAERTK